MIRTMILCLAFSGAVIAIEPAAGQSNAERPMRLVVSAAAGTAPDIIARLISQKISERFKRVVVVENKPGANGGIAAADVMRSEPDGGTLLVTPAGTLTANPSLYPQATVTAVMELAPVTQIATVDFIVAARSTLNVKTLPALLDYIRSHPGKVNAATTAHGSFPHLAAEMLKQKTGLDFTIVKNNGGSQAGSAVAGGHADFVIETAAVLDGLVKAGLLVPLASTGKQRGERTPDLPTVSEAGIGEFAMSGWIALAAPKGTPLSARDSIQEAVASALADPIIRERLEALNFTAVASTPVAMEALVSRERSELDQLIRRGGLVGN
jgi:tripartite-type tricarboxylate transporter receptor subunit TctC